jgi:hypothetical protein
MTDLMMIPWNGEKDRMRTVGMSGMRETWSPLLENPPTTRTTQTARRRRAAEAAWAS